jgi:hypothetical protein
MVDVSLSRIAEFLPSLVVELAMGVDEVVMMVCFVSVGASLNRSALSLPTSMYIPYYWQREAKAQMPIGNMQIEDVISFGTEVLFLVRVPPSSGFLNKERLQCRFRSSHTKVLAVHLQAFLATVVCAVPRVGHTLGSHQA